MGKRGMVRGFQAVLGAGIVAIATWGLLKNWRDVPAAEVIWELNFAWLLLSLALTWLMYLLLIAGWQRLIVAAGEKLPLPVAVQIWLLANLGKYIPGKIWSLVGMGVLAQRAGVRSAVAVGSSVVMQLLALATGSAVAIGLLGTAVVDDQVYGGWVASASVGGLALLSTLLITSPRLMAWLGQRIGRPDALRSIPLRQVMAATVPNLLAWLGYGLALVWVAKGTLPGVSLGWVIATGAFAASYLAGYLFVLAPGGLGVREAVLVLVLQDSIGSGNALALAFASRGTLTINELGAALPLLLSRRTSRDVT
jgi:uncharacterized membrane protein YbhN (UPF0104 family)